MFIIKRQKDMTLSLIIEVVLRSDFLSLDYKMFLSGGRIYTYMISRLKLRGMRRNPDFFHRRNVKHILLLFSH